MAHKILIVDDDKDIAEAIKLILELEGFETQTVSDNNRIAPSIKEFNPDVILLDILLSGVDGRAICKTLKNDKHFQHIPIIMMSAYPDASKSAFEAGADAFLPKPFDADFLVEKVLAFAKSLPQEAQRTSTNGEETVSI